LITAALAVACLVRWLLVRRPRPRPLDIVLDEPVQTRPTLVQLAIEDDTTPAVLSPPEWKPPKKAA